MPRLLFAFLIPMLAACGSSENGPGLGADASSGDVDARVPAGGDVPSEAAALFSFLVAGDYLGYEAESAVHRSAGPHGSGVRTFLNASLAASLAAGSTEHPVGAASIKELYAADGTTVTGWAVAVKVSAGTSGDTWYWYEVFSTTDGSRPIEGIGNTTCTGCHSSGADHVRVGYPLL